jgi:hypothetical protein
MNDKFIQFRTKYIEELTKFRLENPGIAGIDHKKSAEETVDLMINAINKGNREDWLKYNPVMKVAANFVGIKKSPELREFIKASVAEQS